MRQPEPLPFHAEGTESSEFSGRGVFGQGQRLDLDFLWQRGCGNGRGDFQHAIAILGEQPVLVDAFGEVEAALERAVGNLSVVVICLLGFADVAAFAANRQSVALYWDVDIFLLYARAHIWAVLFFVLSTAKCS